MQNTSYPIPVNKARSLRSPENLARLRKKSRQVSREIVLDHDRERLWPLLRHTDLLNQQVGMKTTTNFFLAQQKGGSLMHARGKNGPFPVAYEEFPYIWEAPVVYAVERVFVKGPIKYLQFKVELNDLSNDQTRVVCSIQFVASLPPPVAKLVIGQEIDKFMATFQRLSQRLEQGQQGLLPFFRILPEKALVPWVEKWAEFTAVRQLAHKMAHYLLCAPERLAYRLRPREFAAWYDLDPLDVLNLCLYLVHHGDLRMQWDCRCPGCKGPKESYSQLSQLQAVGYCESCATHYGVAFDQNIELTFSPAPHLRKVTDAFFCAGSPGNTPHVAWQQVVPPQTNVEFDLRAPSGNYVLRSPQFTHEQPLTLDPNLPTKALTLGLKATEPEGIRDLLACDALELAFENTTDEPITLMLENVAWEDLAITAAEVQCVPLFHDVFPTEVLHAELELPLSYQVFLQIYWAQADAELLTWSEQQLKQFQGALLQHSRTLQSMRWVFASAFDALAAAWSVQESFQDMAGFYAAEQRLSLTLSAGPCVVQSKAGGLHYTGTAPEELTQRTARAETLSGHNIVVPVALFSEPGMTPFLEPENYQVKVYRLGDNEVQFHWPQENYDGF